MGKGPKGVVKVLKGKYLTVLLVVLGVAVLLLAGANPPVNPADAAEGPMEYVVTVRGFGTVDARPDTAMIRLGVETEAAKAEDAMEANATALNKVIDALKKAGVKDGDIATGNFSVWPVYQEPPRTLVDEKPSIGTAGYRVSNTLMVRTTNLDTVGLLIDTAAAAGANRVEGISFDKKDADGVRDEAMKVAIKDARRKADVMAAAAGVKIGEIVSVTEEGSGYGIMRTERISVAMDTTIIPGDMEFTSIVVVVYRFTK
jgi:uncharacterized protein YggE